MNRKEKIKEINFALDSIIPHCKDTEDEEDRVDSLKAISEDIFSTLQESSVDNVVEAIQEQCIEMQVVEDEDQFFLYSDDVKEQMDLIKNDKFEYPPEKEEEEPKFKKREIIADCPICLREMYLTKHHLRPRELHKRYMNKKGMKKEELNKGVDICRECHNEIHRFISNDEMAETYFTLEKIMQHEKVKKFVPYIRKQKTPKNKMLQRKYRR